MIFQLAKSGVELTMIVLPPDITTSLTVFGSNDGINNSFRCEEVGIHSPCLLNYNKTFFLIKGGHLHQETQVRF